MAYARKATGGRRRPTRRRLTRVGRSYTARTAYSRTPRKRRVTRRTTMKRGTPFNAYALAHVDPFDDRCRGIKIPDANTMPSVGLTISQETTMICDGTNANAHVFVPSPGVFEVTATRKNLGSNFWGWATASTDYVLPAACQNPSNKLAAITAGYDLVRTVAHGVRLSCGLSPTTVTGFAHISISSRPMLANYADDFFPKNIAEMSESTWYKRVPLATLTQRPLTVVNKILDTTATTYASPRRAFVSEGAGALEVYQSIGSSPGSFDRDSLNGFANIVIAVEGAPSGSSPLVIETIMHLEALPRSVGLQSGSLAAPSRPDVLAGVSHMASTTPAEHFEGEEASAISRAASAFAAGASAAAGGIVETVIDAAGRAGYAATEHAFRRAVGAASGYVPGVGRADRLLT